MKIRTFNTNLIDAISQDTSVPDRNLPVYISNYTVRVASSALKPVDILWSTVGFVPSYEIEQRIFHVRLCASVHRPPSSVDPLADITFLFDFSALGKRFIDQWNISLRGPLEGYITDGNAIRCLSAFRHISYEYDATVFQLLLYVRDLPPIQVAPGEPTMLFIDLSIKDDINDPDYPTAFPTEIAQKTMNIPMGTPYRGRGIRIVLPLFICCPDELKTMQLSSLDPNLEGAFNPVPEIRYLMSLQNVVVPEDFDVSYIDASASPLSPDPPINWKENAIMRATAYVMEILFSLVPECSVIVLYSFANDVQRPAYMQWLSDNIAQYDMVLQSVSLRNDKAWELNAFQQTEQFYDEVQRTLFSGYRPFIVATGNRGNEDGLTYPNRFYDFNLASIYSIGIGGFELSRDPTTQQYDLLGPYRASQLSSGGYSNQVTRPPYQYGTNYRNLYGRPDVAGYFGYYNVVTNAPLLDEIVGTQCAAVLWTALFAMIMEKTQRKAWNFKFILYRKGMTIIDPLYEGQNLGSLPYNSYNARNYPYWNPITGMGRIIGQYLLDMCDVIRNFQVVQISSLNGMDNPVAFINAMPPNPFGDLITRQPVMGCASIFSLFRIKRVDGNDPPFPTNDPIRGNDIVYFVDVTDRFALAYATDENGKWFVVLSKVNYASSAQKWILTFPIEPTSRAPIQAFDEIVIAPSLQPLYSLTTKWNAGEALPANSPSISYDIVGTPEYFVLCTDPASEPFLEEIVSNLTDDIETYSYYLNLASLASPSGSNDKRGDIVYLNNPDFLGMEDDSMDIYAARNRARSQNVIPKWGYKFDPYPQWVLVPVPCTYTNPAAVPYEPQLLRGGQFMIFNTILQSYLYVPANMYVPPERVEPYLKPLSSDITDTIPFYQFVFTITDALTIFSQSVNSKIFQGVVPTTPSYIHVPLPINLRLNPYNAQLYIYNLWMDTESPRDGIMVSNSFLNADTSFTRDLLITQAQGDIHFGDELNMFWVFKKFIASQSSRTRLMPYNNNPDVFQENSGFSLCAEGASTNINNHAPSFIVPTVTTETACTWFNVTDSSIVDVNFPTSPANTYGILRQGLSAYDPEATEWQVVSEKRFDADPTATFALGVYGNPPQPSMVRTPFPEIPAAVRWNATDLNRFYVPPYAPFDGPLRRSNYLYMNTIYTLYTTNPQSRPSGLAGFLSSARNDGAEPSIVGKGIPPRIVDGDNNTLFLLYSPDL